MKEALNLLLYTYFNFGVLNSVLRVCLLGSTGFVGSAFANIFQREGIDFHGIHSRNYEQYIGTEYDILINTNGSSTKYLADKNPRLDFTLNVRSVVDSLHDFKFRLYVYLSSIDVYNNVSDPSQNHEEVPIDSVKLSNYGFHKYLAELAVRKYAVDWLIFRLGGMVGKGLKKNPIFDLIHGQPLRVHPDSAYQYINTDDVARFVWQIALTRLSVLTPSPLRGEGRDEGDKVSTSQSGKSLAPLTLSLSKGLSLSKEHLSNKSGEIFNLCGDGVITLKEVQRMLGITYQDNGIKREWYEVDVEKVKQMMEIPETYQTIKIFISSPRT